MGERGDTPAVEGTVEGTEISFPAGSARPLVDARQAAEDLLADGRLIEADELVAAVLSTPAADAPEAGSLRLIRASIGLLRGRPREALEEAEAAVGDGRSGDAAMELFGPASACRLAATAALPDLVRARELAEAILAGREAPGDDQALAGAVNEIGLLAWEEGRLTDALGLLRAAAHRSRSEADELHCCQPGLSVPPVLVAAGDFDGARAAIEAANRELHPIDNKLWAPCLAVLAARVHLAMGAIGAAVAEAEGALRLAERFGTNVFVPRAAWVLASAALLRGDVDEAATRAKVYREETGPGSDGWNTGLFHWTDARLALAQGRDDALRPFAAVFDRPDAYRRLFLEEPASAAWLVRQALRSDQAAGAEVVVACTERIAATNPSYPSVRAVAEHARGVLEQDMVALARAARGHAQPWARASAHEDAATVLENASDHGAAARRLQRAAIAYRSSGAVWDASRVTRRMRRIGRRRGRSRPAGSGWDSLTQTERRVAQLVAEGLTNPAVAHRLTVSRHTVDFHLRQIFRKLDICSRVALARIIGERASRRGPRR